MTLHQTPKQMTESSITIRPRLSKGAKTAERVPIAIFTRPSFTLLYSSRRSPTERAL